jgi:RNA polymerase sigma factor (TIGR02999 family)
MSYAESRMPDPGHIPDSPNQSSHPLPPGDVTLLLEAAERGGEDGRRAVAALLPVVYQELRRLAGAYLQGERAGHTLQPTALVHEVFVKLAGQDRAGWKSREQFLGVAAQAMRRILCDHARIRNAQKRGGGRGPLSGSNDTQAQPDQVLALDEAAEVFEQRAIDLPALDDALERLAALDERKARVVELRFFAGLSVEETGRVLNLPVRTIERDWTTARAWLRAELEQQS